MTLQVGEVDRREAASALRHEISRVTELVSSMTRVDAPALGVWNAAEVAVHLAHAWEILPGLAFDGRTPPLKTLGDLSGMTQALVTAEQPSDMRDVASRIDAAATAYFDRLQTTPAETQSPWLIDGVTVSMTTFTCHLLNETLVHGYDIARAEGLRWAIDRRTAALVLFGFLFPQLGKVDPRAMVVQEQAAGLRACFEIRVRRAGRVLLGFDDGALTVDPEPAPPIDYHISADAAVLFLVLWNRVSQWPAFLRGQMLGWGRKPMLGFRLRALVRNP